MKEEQSKNMHLLKVVDVDDDGSSITQNNLRQLMLAGRFKLKLNPKLSSSMRIE